MVRARQVVNFNKIHTPGGVHIKQGVIIFLCSGPGCINRVHIPEPCTQLVGIVNILSSIVGSQNWQFALNSYFWNAAHDVDAKFQSFLVNIIGQRLKTFSVCR